MVTGGLGEGSGDDRPDWLGDGRRRGSGAFSASAGPSPAGPSTIFDTSSAGGGAAAGGSPEGGVSFSPTATVRRSNIFGPRSPTDDLDPYLDDVDIGSAVVSRGGWLLASAAGLVVIGALALGLTTLVDGSSSPTPPADVAVEAVSVQRSPQPGAVHWARLDRPDQAGVVDFPTPEQVLERRIASTGVGEARDQAPGPRGSTLLFATRPIVGLTGDPAPAVAADAFDGESDVATTPVTTADGAGVNFTATASGERVSGRVLVEGDRAVVMAVQAPSAEAGTPEVAAALVRMIDTFEPRPAPAK